MRDALLSIVALALVAGCGDDAMTGTDAGRPDASGDVDAGLSPEATAALTTATQALGTAAALTAPLVSDAETLRDVGGRMDGEARDSTARDRVESGVSGNSVVTEPSCTTYDWRALTVTITFAGCVLEATGESLDGVVTLAVSFHPTTLALTMEGLSVADTTVDGALTLNVGGECAPEMAGCLACRDGDAECAAMRASQRTVTGSLTVTSGGTTTLSIEEITVSSDASGTTVSGTATIDGSAVVATDVFWATGDCLPTSGAVSVASLGGTIRFLPATPATGEVEVTVSTPLGDVTTTQALFTPCGG